MLKQMKFMGKKKDVSMHDSMGENCYKIVNKKEYNNADEDLRTWTSYSLLYPTFCKYFPLPKESYSSSLNCGAFIFSL